MSISFIFLIKTSPLEVKVSGENNQIKEIEVIKHEEAGFTRRAMKKISDEIITTQSLDVDNIKKSCSKK